MLSGEAQRGNESACSRPLISALTCTGIRRGRVTGQLPESIVDDLEARGVKVHSREMDD